MTIVDRNPFGELDEAELTSFESLLPSELPVDYRKYLLASNGGRPQVRQFAVGNNISTLHVMYGLNNGPSYQRLDENRRILDGRIPPEYLAIGGDENGNHILIGLKTAALKGVFFFDHEYESDDPADNLRQFIRLSTAFEEFLSQLFDAKNQSESLLDRAFDSDNVEQLKLVLATNPGVNTPDQFGHTLIERAAIKNCRAIVEFLYSEGADLGRSLELAKKNLKYFPAYLELVELLSRLAPHDLK